jgi:di/tricarboxylate transporter
MIVGKTLLLVLVLWWTLGVLAQQSNANVAISKILVGGAEVTEAIANESKRMLQAATNVPTAAPTTKNPTRSPSRKPTNRPTLRKSIYGDYMPDELLEYSDQQDTVIVLIIAIFVLMAFEVAAPEVIMLTALMIVVYCEILTLSEGLAGFSNTALITIGALYLVVGAVEKSHVIDWCARNAFGTTGSNFQGQFRLYLASFCLSIFLNNTPIVAILMPVVKDWARMRGMAASQLLMPFEFAVIAGSFGSMIGTSTNLTLQGLMLLDRGYEFSFFAPAPIGWACFGALLVYMLATSKYLLPNNKNGLIREARDKADNLIAEVLVSQNSSAVGKTVSQLMLSLGMSPTLVIKIRRHVSSYKDEDHIDSESYVAKHDNLYWQNAQSFWTNSVKPRLPAFVQAHIYQPASNNESAPAVETEAESHIKQTVQDFEVRNSNDLEMRDVKETDTREPAEYSDIIAPNEDEVIVAGDVVFISSARSLVAKLMKSIAGESRGLRILKSDVMSLPGFGSELAECVISDSNPFRGKKLSEIKPLFAKKYNVGIITVRGKDWGRGTDEPDATTPATNNESASDANEEPKATCNANSPDYAIGDIELTTVESQLLKDHDPEDNNIAAGDISDRKSTSTSPVSSIAEVSDHLLAYGDVVLVVTNQKNVDALQKDSDFFVVSTVGSLPHPLTLYGLIPLFIFLLMIALAAANMLDICAGALLTAAFFLIGGWIQSKDIPKMVDVRLLLLLGSSISFATSMTKSRLAHVIAQKITENNPTPFNAMVMVYVITLFITSLVSNNAAAALMYPIAVKIADTLQVSFKPFAFCVMIAASATFAIPIGYQCHIMVWAPGGYKFRDFVVFGAIPNAIYLVIACYMIPHQFPF